MLSASPLSKFKRCLRHRGTNLSDDADIGMKFWSTCHCSAMSAPLVSLFPDDADSAKTYLAVTQTSLNNLWIRISKRIWISQQNRFSCCLVRPKGTVWWKNRDQKISRYCPFKRARWFGMFAILVIWWILFTVPNELVDLGFCHSWETVNFLCSDSSEGWV